MFCVPTHKPVFVHVAPSTVAHLNFLNSKISVALKPLEQNNAYINKGPTLNEKFVCSLKASACLHVYASTSPKHGDGSLLSAWLWMKTRPYRPYVTVRQKTYVHANDNRGIQHTIIVSDIYNDLTLRMSRITH